MEMNKQFQDYTNEFLKEYEVSRDKHIYLQKLWARKCSEEFIKWFNQIVALALRNLSDKNEDITEREPENPNDRYSNAWGRSNLLVATKNGIRKKYHYGKKSDELDFGGIRYLLEKKGVVEEWIKNNNPDKLDAFLDLVKALEHKTATFGFDNMKKSDSDNRYYYAYQPQFNLGGLKVDFNKPTFSIQRNEVEVAELKEISFSVRSEYFEVKYELFYPKDNGKSNHSFTSSSDKWEWIFQKDILPELNAFLDKSINAVVDIQADFDTWVKEVKDKLQSYATLVAL
jgi:hypothetical protein